MFLLQVLAVLFFLGSVAQAYDYDGQVDDALIILQDIPGDLASGFCQDLVGHDEYESTTTCTVTGLPITTTTTLAPTFCDYGTTPYYSVTSSTPVGPTTAPPWISTVSSTTTITYTTTSTIYVPDTYPTLYKRSAKSLPQRATWCAEFNRPCRLVQYSYPVIEEACEKYLGGGGYSEYVVTSTYTVYPTETETATASECTSEGGYSAPTNVWYDEPVYETPAAPSPVYETPSEPDYEAPTYETPVSYYEKPVYETQTPVYEGPAYGPPTPVYEESAYGNPAYETPTSAYEDLVPEYGAPDPVPAYGDSESSQSYPDDYSKPEYGDDYDSSASYSGEVEDYPGDGNDSPDGDGEDYEDKDEEKPYSDSQDGYSGDTGSSYNESEGYGGGDDEYDTGMGDVEAYPDDEGSYGSEDTSYSSEEQPYAGGGDDWDSMIAGMDPEYVDAVDADDSGYYA